MNLLKVCSCNFANCMENKKQPRVKYTAVMQQCCFSLLLDCQKYYCILSCVCTDCTFPKAKDGLHCLLWWRTFAGKFGASAMTKLRKLSSKVWCLVGLYLYHIFSVAVLGYLTRVITQDFDLPTTAGILERSASCDSLQCLPKVPAFIPCSIGDYFISYSWIWLQVKRVFPPLPQLPPIESTEEEEDDSDVDDERYEKIDILRSPLKAVRRPEAVEKTPTPHYTKKIEARAVSLIDYKPRPRDPQGSLKLKVQICGS